MDAREAMAMSSPPSSYYIHRGLGATGPGGLQQGLHGPQSIRTMPNQNPSLAGQSAAHIGGHSSGGQMGPGFQLDSMAAASLNAGSGGSVVGQGEPVKRKRGRPRKYGPDGGVALALSPLSNTHPTASSGVGMSGSGSGTPKRGRGRPPGTGRKQQLASLGEWVVGSAGMGFTPHIITIAVGEDIATKIMSFSQQGPRAVCILSANGAVSTVTLRQPSTSGGTVTYEGRFEILCLSGSYLMTDEGGSRSRRGGLSISLSSPDGRVIGGSVGGLLIAATPVQVIVGSFLYGGSKVKNKSKTDQESSGTEHELSVGDTQITPISMMPNPGIPTSLMGGWPGSRQLDMRNSDMRNSLDIDLTRG